MNMINKQIETSPNEYENKYFSSKHKSNLGNIMNSARSESIMSSLVTQNNKRFKPNAKFAPFYRVKNGQSEKIFNSDLHTTSVSSSFRANKNSSSMKKTHFDPEQMVIASMS